MRYLIAVVLLSACAVAKDETTFTVPDEVQNALRGVALLRDTMRDPDSLVIEHVYARMSHKPDHPMLCISYRAHNGFGGYSHDVAEYKGGNNLNPGTLKGIGWCTGIERNLDRLERKGWAEITEEYAKAASAKEQKADKK
jgi:hypothetical protein